MVYEKTFHARNASHACNTSSILVPTTKEKEEMQFNYISSFSL